MQIQLKLEVVIYILLIHVIEIPRFWLKSRGLFEEPFLKMVLKRLQLRVNFLYDAHSHKFGVFCKKNTLRKYTGMRVVISMMAKDIMFYEIDFDTTNF